MARYEDYVRWLREAGAQTATVDLAGSSAVTGGGSSASAEDAHASAAVEMVQTFGFYEAEYAAIRRGVGLMPRLERAILRLTGKDVGDFLHRILTQDIRGMTGGQSRRALLLNDKGRIVADMIVHRGELDTWLDMDVWDVPGVRRTLEDRLFGEDVQLEDWSGERLCVGLYGPAVGPVLKQTCEGGDERMFGDMPGTHHVLRIAGAPVSAYHTDECGGPGVRLWLPVESAVAVSRKLAETMGGLAPEGKSQGRGIGWLAYNTARVEAGTALFHVDYGTDCLPHEAGAAIIRAAVHFQKGCYLGQEIVARMENLGHPKRVLTQVVLKDDRLPIAGQQVLDASGQVVGAVTSSAISPLRGNVAVCLAMMKWGQHQSGTVVRLPAEGELVEGVVA